MKIKLFFLTTVFSIIFSYSIVFAEITIPSVPSGYIYYNVFCNDKNGDGMGLGDDIHIFAWNTNDVISCMSTSLSTFLVVYKRSSDMTNLLSATNHEGIHKIYYIGGSVDNEIIYDTSTTSKLYGTETSGHAFVLSSNTPILGVEGWDDNPSGTLYSPFDSSPYQSLTNGLHILLPQADGFKDNTQMFNFNVAFKIPTSKTSISELQFKVIPSNGYDRSNSLEPDFELLEGSIIDGYAMGTMKFGLPLPVGKNTISFSLEDTYTATRSVERLTGFVDTDSDGVDDRTGLPTSWGDGSPTLDTDTTWNTMVSALKNTGGLFEGIGSLFGSIFSWLPVEMKSILLLATTIIFVVIIKRTVL